MNKTWSFPSAYSLVREKKKKAQQHIQDLDDRAREDFRKEDI